MYTRCCGNSAAEIKLVTPVTYISRVTSSSLIHTRAIAERRTRQNHLFLDVRCHCVQLRSYKLVVSVVTVRFHIQAPLSFFFMYRACCSRMDVVVTRAQNECSDVINLVTRRILSPPYFTRRDSSLLRAWEIPCVRACARACVCVCLCA